MDLSSEDNFRLNVMLANDVKAVRINESTMTVYGLLEKGESAIRLNATCRDDKYLRYVRELLSSHVLGSPGGYPVFLKRWTRMGQARDGSLESLLMLGEPEAIVAVVHAAGLTGEIGRLAWWSMPDAQNARCMLANKAIVEDPIGKELAEFLLEFLPFEEDPEAMMETVRLVVQPGLLSNEAVSGIWKRAKQKNACYIGFLQMLPDDLPEPLLPHPKWEQINVQLKPLLEEGNPFAVQLCRCLSAQGQTYLGIAETVMRKPANQEVVVRLLNTINTYFSSVCIDASRNSQVPTIIEDIRACCESAELLNHPCKIQLHAVLECDPGLRPIVHSMLGLASITDAVVTPIFAQSDAIGTVMRRKLEPVTGPIFELIKQLQGGQKI